MHSNRRSNIDFLRIIAALAVVVIHSFTSPVSSGESNYWSRLVASNIHMLMMWSVPVFFMITGYCLCLKKELSYRYCLRHALKFVAVLFTVGLCYALMELVYQNGGPGSLLSAGSGSPAFRMLQLLGQAILKVLNGDLWSHLWYVYAIIGVYLAMPVLHKFLTGASHSDRWTLVGILFFFSIGVPLLSRVTGGEIQLDVYFPIMQYSCYVCFGGVMAGATKIDRRAGIASVLGIVIPALWMWFFVEEVGYTDPLVAIMAVSIFTLCLYLPLQLNGFWTEVAKCTFGIYLLHPLLLNVITKILHLDLVKGLWFIKLPICVVILFAGSGILTWILRKIPVIRKLF